MREEKPTVHAELPPNVLLTLRPNFPEPTCPQFKALYSESICRADNCRTRALAYGKAADHRHLMGSENYAHTYLQRSWVAGSRDDGRALN